MSYWHAHGYLYILALKKAFKFIFLLFVVGFFCWCFFLKKPIYQHVYGIPTNTTLNISNIDTFVNLSKPLKSAIIKERDYTIQVDFVKSFHTTAKVVYIDRYNFIGTWYRSSRYKRNAKLYDTIVPLDLSLATGPMVYPNLFEDFTFDNEYRLFFAKTKKPNIRIHPQHFSNNHIIPANKKIKKALDILKVGDTVSIKGYLVNLKGLGQDHRFKLTSALESGEISNQLFGGRRGGKCRLIYITGIIFDGYEFK